MEVLKSTKPYLRSVDSLNDEGINYEETFAPIERYTSIKTIMALATMTEWKLHYMDVKKTFLNGVIEEEVYIVQPHSFEVENKIKHVCRLKKAMYRLKCSKRWC